MTSYQFQGLDVVDAPQSLEHRNSDQISANSDWISFNTELPNRARLNEFFLDILGDLPVTIVDRSFQIAANKYHDKTIQSPDPSVRGGLSVNQYGQYAVYLQLKGKWWESKTPADTLRIIGKLANYRCDCSRIDLRMDDWSGNWIPLEQMIEAAKRGDVAWMQKYQLHYGSEVGDGGQLKGAKFGGPKSEAFVIVYWHYWGEELGYSLRMECQFSNQKAKSVFNGLKDLQIDKKSDVNEQVADWMISRVTGQHDFINKTKNGTRSPKGINQQDCKRLPFWQQFLEDVGEAVKITVTRHKSSWQDRIDWMYFALAKSVFMLRFVYEQNELDQFLTNLEENGRKRMKDDDCRSLEQLMLDKDKVTL